MISMEIWNILERSHSSLNECSYKSNVYSKALATLLTKTNFKAASIDLEKRKISGQSEGTMTLGNNAISLLIKRE